MADLPPLLIDALAAIGPATEAQMSDLMRDFAALPLSEEGRLTVLAGTVATIAMTRYRPHRAIFIAALRSWALEISIALAPPRPRLERRSGSAEEALDFLLGGIDAILHDLRDTGSAKHQRLVTELAMMARLLGRYDAPSIHLVLTAATGACDNPIWQCGDIVPVSICDSGLPLTRDVSIAGLAPRGTA